MSDYVPFHSESRELARKLAYGIMDPKERYLKITDYVERSFAYDYIRAIRIPKRNGKPDVPGCWKKHMGICLDVAAMTTGMLQAVGLNAKMCIGHAGKSYHAWVETEINGETYLFDHRSTGKVKSYHTERTYA